MPKLHRSIEKSTFFLFRLSPDPADDHKPENERVCGPNGTGVFISKQSELVPDLSHIYAASNWHVVREASWIRVNGKNGTRLIKFEPSDWEYSKDEDLCVIDVTDHLLKENGEYVDVFTTVDERHFVTHDFVKRRDVGIGDSTIMIGLFANHDGGKSNAPVGRFGNIAAMPDPENPVRFHSEDKYLRPAYLNDMRSRTGFSGSPVWVYRIGSDDLTHLPPDTMELGGLGIADSAASFLRFLGIHRGQFRESTEIFSTEGLSSEGLVKHGDEIFVASAMTAVIPAWELSAVLNYPTLIKQREVRDRRPDRVKEATDIRLHLSA